MKTDSTVHHSTGITIHSLHSSRINQNGLDCNPLLTRHQHCGHVLLTADLTPTLRTRITRCWLDILYWLYCHSCIDNNIADTCHTAIRLQHFIRHQHCWLDKTLWICWPRLTSIDLDSHQLTHIHINWPDSQSTTISIRHPFNWTINYKLNSSSIQLNHQLQARFVIHSIEQSTTSSTTRIQSQPLDSFRIHYASKTQNHQAFNSML